jgi:uncharacterized protein (TIGR02145 family)
MKKTFFFFAMLASVAASATVTVTPLGIDYAAQKVTFKVAWTGSAYDNRVWVWIDLCPVPGVTLGAFQDAVISAASATSGSVLYASTNTRGFFVTANPSTVTATLSNAVGKFNWCAYGSDYPPNVTLENGTYTFKGTSSFLVSSHAQPLASKTIAKASLTVNSQSTFTDATGCPGIGSLYCPCTGSDLYMDASHRCLQRTTGAKNWEAYIKDSRDNNIYRIIQMPDNKWYMAQNLNYRGVTYYCYGYNAANCNETNGVWYKAAQVNATLCSYGWHVPTLAEWTDFVSAGGTLVANYYDMSSGGNDRYGYRLLLYGMGNDAIQYWFPGETYGNVYHVSPATGVVSARFLLSNTTVQIGNSCTVDCAAVLYNVRCMKD